jgi:hypothetical protein
VHQSGRFPEKPYTSMDEYPRSGEEQKNQYLRRVRRERLRGKVRTSQRKASPRRDPRSQTTDRRIQKTQCLLRTSLANISAKQVPRTSGSQIQHKPQAELFPSLSLPVLHRLVLHRNTDGPLRYRGAFSWKMRCSLYRSTTSRRNFS